MRACSSGVSFGIEPLGLERGVADRLGAERVEVRGEVAVHAVRLDERHRGGDAAEEHLVGTALGAAPAGRRPARRGAAGAATCRAPLPSRQRLEQPREAGERRDELAVAALEQRAPLRRNGLRVLEVLLEEQRARSRRSGRRRQASLPLL